MDILSSPSNLEALSRRLRVARLLRKCQQTVHVVYTNPCLIDSLLRTGAAASLFDDCNPDWAPTQHLGYSRTLDKPNPSRYRRLSRRRQQLKLTPKQGKTAFNLVPSCLSRKGLSLLIIC